MGGFLGTLYRSIAVVTVVCLVPAVVKGESLSPFRTQVKLQGFNEISLKRSSRGAAEREVIPAVRLAGTIRGEGRIDARFTIRRNKVWSSSILKDGIEISDPIDPVLLQGELAIGRAWRRTTKALNPSAASIINRKLVLTFPGRIRGTRKSRQRIYTLHVAIDGSLQVTAKVSSIPALVIKSGACSSSSNDPAYNLTGTVPVMAAATAAEAMSSVVTLSTDADAEWYARYGAESNAQIAKIINTAEALYQRQLGIRFRIVKQHVYAGTSPYVSTDPGALLASFAHNPANAANIDIPAASASMDVDLKHLFTGKDLDGGVVGIAYIGALCAVPELSYGLTQGYSDIATPGIFAHEVGHNFGASHDTADPSGIMYPSISIPPSDHFSTRSINEITSHLAQYGSCISQENLPPQVQATPTPVGAVPTAAPTPWRTPSSSANPVGGLLTISKQKVGDPKYPVVRLYGRMMTAQQTASIGTSVLLVADGTVITQGMTNAKGRYEFFVRVSIPSTKRIAVLVQDPTGSAISKNIWLRKTTARKRR